MQTLYQAGAYAKEEVCRTLVVLISNEPKLHAYAARQSFRSLQSDAKNASLLLMLTTTWFLGTPSASAASASTASAMTTDMWMPVLQALQDHQECYIGRWYMGKCCIEISKSEVL